MDERLERALADVLARLEAGLALTTDWLRRTYPDCWEQLRDALEVDSVIAETIRTPEVLGPFRIVRELGRGGMGTVYLAETLEPTCGAEVGTRVAVKVLHRELVEPGFPQRLRREAEIGGRIRHRNVVCTLGIEDVHHAGRLHHCLVTEFVEGQTLRSLVRSLGRAPEELCRHLAAEVARALEAIHAAGVVHRDLKPENVLLTADGTVRVMDLGVAILTDGALRISRTGGFIGSLLYAAPEQFDAVPGRVDGRADLYALGLVLYELLSGRHPFGDGDVRVLVKRQIESTPAPLTDLDPQVSPFLDAVVRTLLAKDRELRFQSASELLAVLSEAERSPWWTRRAAGAPALVRRSHRATRVQRETGLHGRDDLLAQLRRHFDLARDGSGQVVLLEGEAGVGKTRLVDAFVEELSRGEPVDFLWGSYPPGGAAAGSSAFVTAFREHLGTQGLDALLVRHLAARTSLVPAFAALLRGEPAPSSAPELSRDSLHCAFVETALSLAAERPLVCLIDDLHFASDEGRSLFAALAHALPGARILLVGAGRTALPAAWIAAIEHMGHAAVLRVPRLCARDVVQLVAEAVGSEHLAEELAPAICTASDGNPYFVLESLRSLRGCELLVRRADGAWERTDRVREIRLPSTVTDLIKARLEGLADADRELLDMAACCGFEFDATLVGDALGLPRVQALRQFAEAERSLGLVRAAGPSFVFDHHQLHETIYRALPDPLREQYHALLAQALEQRESAAGREPSGAVAAALCGHFLRGGLPNRALRTMSAAVHHLELSEAHDEVVRVIDRALAAPLLLRGAKRADALLRKVNALNALGRREEEGAALDEALPLADDAMDAGCAARARHLKARWLRFVGRAAEAGPLLHDGLRLAREAGDRRLESRLHAGLGLLARAQGRREEALSHHEREFALAVETDDRQAVATASGYLGNTLRDLGRSDEVRGHFERQLAVAREIGHRGIESNACGSLAIHFSDLGLTAAALPYFERNLELCAALGLVRHRAITLENLGFLRAFLGDLRRAAAAFDDSLRLFTETDDRRQMGRSLRGRATVSDWSGDVAQARSQYEAALALHRETGDVDLVPVTLTALGALALREGRTDAARSAFEEAVAAATACGGADQIVLSRTHLALVSNEAVARAREALDRHETSLVPVERMEDRFILFRAAGDPADLAHARRLLDEFREHAPAASRGPMIENVPLHRDIEAASNSLFRAN